MHFAVCTHATCARHCQHLQVPSNHSSSVDLCQWVREDPWQGILGALADTDVQCRCSVYTTCLARSSICATATATAAVAADTTAPVITVRAPVSNSVSFGDYVTTTVYVGMFAWPFAGLWLPVSMCVSCCQQAAVVSRRLTTYGSAFRLHVVMQTADNVMVGDQNSLKCFSTSFLTCGWSLFELHPNLHESAFMTLHDTGACQQIPHVSDFSTHLVCMSQHTTKLHAQHTVHHIAQRHDVSMLLLYEANQEACYHA